MPNVTQPPDNPPDGPPGPRSALYLAVLYEWLEFLAARRGLPPEPRAA